MQFPMNDWLVDVTTDYTGKCSENVSWWDWYVIKSVRSRKDAEKLMRPASADDAEAALVAKGRAALRVKTSSSRCPSS